MSTGSPDEVEEEVTERQLISEARSRRKEFILSLADREAPQRARWIARNRYFHQADFEYLRFLIPEGSSILDLGCGTGDLLARLEPSRGVGIDFSRSMVEAAQVRHPDLTFFRGDIEDAQVMASIEGPFDVVLLSDTIGSLDDCELTLAALHRVCNAETRIIISYYSKLWDPILRLAEALRLKMPQAEQNALSTEDIEALLELADFEVVKREWRQLIPRRLAGLGTLVNRLLAPLPLVRSLCLRNYLVARSKRASSHLENSVSIVIPCRNEKGNIEAAVQRIPRFAEKMEIIFVEGRSKDGTLDEALRVQANYPQWDIQVMVQDGRGKGDAVRKGFAAAKCDILFILDADLTVPPEELPKFYRAIVTGKGEFINGSRLVYPMESQAMRFLNYLANRTFSFLFSWLLNQRLTDTLCGTKVLYRHHYMRISANRSYFGDFDPFGDFDLLFGASKMNLKLVEVPIRYANRTYGETQISRFRHGWLLLRMVVFAFRKLKAF